MSTNVEKKKISILENPILFSFISVILGLLVGAIVLLIANINPIESLCFFNRRDYR